MRVWFLLKGKGGNQKKEKHRGAQRRAATLPGSRRKPPRARSENIRSPRSWPYCSTLLLCLLLCSALLLCLLLCCLLWLWRRSAGTLAQIGASLVEGIVVDDACVEREGSTFEGVVAQVEMLTDVELLAGLWLDIKNNRHLFVFQTLIIYMCLCVA